MMFLSRIDSIFYGLRSFNEEFGFYWQWRATVENFDRFIRTLFFGFVFLREVYVD